MDITSKIKEFEKTSGGKVGFGLWDKASGFKCFYNENKKFTAASLNKIFIVGCVLDRISQKKNSLDEKIKIDEGDIVGGTGVSHLLSVREYSVDDLCLLAIAESDNTVANKLVDICGGLNEVNRYTQEIGLKDTVITHKFMLYKGEPTSTVSVRDLTRYFDLLSEGKIALGNKLKGYLLEQKYRHRTGFSIKGRYGLKTADLPHPDAVVHDAGILFDDSGDVILVILTEGASDRRETMQWMQKASKMLYDYITFNERLRSALPEASGFQPPVKGFTDNSYKFGEEVDGWGRHLGQDYAVKAGTLVTSIAEGKVVYSHLHPATEEKKNWGNVVIIAHKYKGKLVFSLYGHLGERLVELGTEVEKGQQIGTVGKGYTPENGNWEEHLHFAIFRGDFLGQVLPGYDPPGNIKEWIDPMEFLR